jgi:hypothetical protein
MAANNVSPAPLTGCLPAAPQVARDVDHQRLQR